MTSLTPADIQTLRLSCPSLRNLGGGVNMGFPYIIYLPGDGLFCLHAYGSPQAKSPDAALLAECLRQERAEPGFIRRILSTATDVDEASLDPQARQRRASAQRAALISAAQTASTTRAQLARRASALDPRKLSLDDLL